MNMQILLCNRNSNDNEFDFYPTPEYVTKALLERETFEGNVHDPCCGIGNIIKFFPRAVATDLIDRGYRPSFTLDYLRHYIRVDNVVCSPPFKHANLFVTKALHCATKKVAMLLPLDFLTGIKRYNLIINSPLRTVYVFSHRVDFKNHSRISGGFLKVAWFVWDHSYNGKPTIDLIPKLILESKNNPKIKIKK